MSYTRRQFLKSAAAYGGIMSLLPFPAHGLGQGMSSRKVQPAPRPKFSGRPFPVIFADVAQSAGLTASTVYGERYVKRYIVEANGPGIAFLDYDQDGWLDIFVPSGTRLGGFPHGSEPTNHLYHNNCNGTFTDVTEKAGLTHSGWCYGVCIGDYDNNGYDDLFLTYFGKNVLYRNNGDGTFKDVTRQAGLEQKRERYGSGCTFIDYDRDGYLDLFVSRYIDLDLSKTPVGGQNHYCRFRGISVNCGPLGLPEESCSLYHNNRDGTFTDVTAKAGMEAAGKRYGLTAVALDYNNDGWPDLFVACDSSPNLLFRNNHNGTFTETGLAAGVAVNGDGQEQANMGVAAGDYDGDGWIDLFATHFSDDTPVLYRNLKGDFFDDVTTAAGLAVDTRYVGWGAGFEDFDNDGWLDLFLVTGSVYPEVEKVYPDYPYETPRLVFRNLGNGTFEEVSQLCGAAVNDRHSSRGCAFGDFNNDGSVDVLILNMSEPPSLLLNQNHSGNHWLSVKLVGVQSNRSALGARITLSAGGRRQVREVMGASSYLSQNDLRQHFGLGRSGKVDAIEVRWPSGLMQRYANLEADQFITLREGDGKIHKARY
jgi:hypothetical protein